MILVVTLGHISSKNTWQLEDIFKNGGE
jgi:hypothetical protein